jgi:serine/threonine-protein kinase RsbW
MRQELILMGASPDLALEALRWTEGACARAGLAANQARDLATAVVEAVNNCLEHGYTLVPGDVAVALDDFADRIVVTVSDHGHGLPPLPASAAPDPLAERGRGSWIMQQTCDEVRHEIQGDAQSVVLVKRRASVPKLSTGEIR